MNFEVGDKVRTDVEGHHLMEVSATIIDVRHDGLVKIKAYEIDGESFKEARVFGTFYPPEYFILIEKGSVEFEF
ncbi:MAG: hypothetical protein RR744_00290 [Cellulosilyticaceae bacterium]